MENGFVSIRLGLDDNQVTIDLSTGPVVIPLDEARALCACLAAFETIRRGAADEMVRDVVRQTLDAFKVFDETRDRLRTLIS